MAAAAKVLLSVLDYLDVDGFAGLTALLCHPGFGALAEAVPTKARGTRQFDGRHKGSPAPSEKDDAKLPLLNAGSMWQGDISQRLWGPWSEISACESSKWAMSIRHM
jgi:hypothetical protein